MKSVEELQKEWTAEDCVMWTVDDIVCASIIVCVSLLVGILPLFFLF